MRALHVMDLTRAAADSPSYSVVQESAKSRLREIRRELRLAGVPESATVVAAGSPARAIRQAAARGHASLLIVGINGARSRKPNALGATARALLGHAPCPVLTVSRACDERAAKASACFDRPLFITDTAPESLRAAIAAWPTLSSSRQIRIVLPADGHQRLQPDPAIPRRFAPAHVLPLPGAAHALLREAADTAAGIIVLAFRTGGYLDSFASGSVAHALITTASCPVLTVRC